MNKYFVLRGPPYKWSTANVLYRTSDNGIYRMNDLGFRITINYRI